MAKDGTLEGSEKKGETDNISYVAHGRQALFLAEFFQVVVALEYGLGVCDFFLHKKVDLVSMNSTKLQSRAFSGRLSG